MARKTKSSFCDVSIHSDEQIGASLYNNDAFYKVIQREIANHADYEDISAPHLVKKHLGSSEKSSHPKAPRFIAILASLLT
jgi:hypothetical protein